MNHQNNDDLPIRKIINPKNGGHLYLRQFKDSTLAQVSSHQSFPIPIDTINHKVDQTHSDQKKDTQHAAINTSIIELQQRFYKLEKNYTGVVNALNRQNKYLTYIIYALIVLFILYIY